MSDSDWSSEHEGVKPPKKGIPGWVWGCGGGCALLLVIGVVLAFFGMRFARGLVDQEANWAKIDAVLPVVERPEGYFAVGMPMKIDGISIWTLIDQAGDKQVVLFHGEGGDSTEDTRRELFAGSSDVQLGGPLKGYGRNDVEAGTLLVQGRELQVLRYQAVSKDARSEGVMGKLQQAMDGANLIVDLSPPDSDEFLALIFTKQRTREPVSDEELLDLLSCFRIPGGSAQPPGELAPEAVPAEERDE